MHVVVVVVRHKRLGQRVQRREVWVHHGPLPQRVVVPHKFPWPPWLHEKPPKRSLFRPSHVCLAVHEYVEHARRALNGRKQQVSWCHRQVRRRSVGQHPSGRHQHIHVQDAQSPLALRGMTHETQACHHDKPSQHVHGMGKTGDAHPFKGNEPSKAEFSLPDQIGQRRPCPLFPCAT